MNHNDFANCEARGLDPESIRKYRAAVDPFIEHCGVTQVRLSSRTTRGLLIHTQAVMVLLQASGTV
jgi:hypothetical protein